MHTETYRYNDQLLLDSTVFLLFNRATDEFDRNTKTAFLYNDSGQNRESTSSDWNTSLKKWEAADRFLSTYDGDNLIELLGLKYNSTTSQWDNELLQTFTYKNSKLKTITFQGWENNEWVNETRLTYTYNSGGNVIEFLTEKWENDNWLNLDRTTSTYDEQAYLIKSVLQQWDQVWFDFLQKLYTNNDDGFPTEVVNEKPAGSNKWTPITRELNTYDNNNNLTEYLLQFYGGEDVWNDFIKTTYTYDNNHRLIEEVTEDFLTLASTRISYAYEDDREVEQLTEQRENNQWVNFSKTLSYWSSSSTSVEDLESINLSIVMTNPILKGDMIHCQFQQHLSLYSVMSHIF
jgi:hypothetical protein